MGTIGHAGPHGGLHEPAPAEALELVTVLVELARALHALGEDEDQLALVVEEPVGIVGVGGDARRPATTACRPPAAPRKKKSARP